jgi:hypothetical protein
VVGVWTAEQTAARDERGLAAAYAGSYTVVQASGEELRVFTDLRCAWPVYLARHGGGMAWASSARMLAGLTGARPDPAWLAATLIDPAACRCRPETLSLPLTRPPGGRSRGAGRARPAAAAASSASCA